MNIKLFKQVRLTSGMLQQFVTTGSNVLLIGQKGSGKSQKILGCFQKHFKGKYSYLAGATADPWTDIVGVPIAKDDGKGGKVIEYARPNTIPDDVQAIFIDQFNRAPKKIKNSFMQLIQFKSVNGRKYPNLKVVWAACNPWDQDNQSAYDVQKLDPAHLDRFHVIINVNGQPDIKYFVSSYGEKGKQAVIWWKQQSIEAKKTISSRRLSYAIDSHNKNIDLKFILPSNANVDELMKTLSMDALEQWFDDFKKEFEQSKTGGQIPLLKIKEIAQPGEKHNRFFQKSCTLKSFYTYAEPFLGAQQKNAYNSTDTAKVNNIASTFKLTDFKGKKVSISGIPKNTTKAKVEETLTNIGAILVDNVTKHNCDILLTFNTNEKSTKINLANFYKKPIVSGDNLF